MAIQIPNAGTGNGATGDNEFVLWTKVINNFSDQTNAASRLVGGAVGSIPIMTSYGLGGWGLGSSTNTNNPAVPLDNLRYMKSGFFFVPGSLTAPDFELESNSLMLNISFEGGRGFRLFTNDFSNKFYLQSSEKFINKIWRAPVEIRTTGNTTVDANGFIKAASPIVKVYADKIILNDDAQEQNVTFTKNGVGDYTINTVSGLSTDGWSLELPKDLNGNPKIAVTLSETAGVISLKSYKRIFSMETFTFTPDLEQPLDIPDGRWIDLRLNEIEKPEMQPEV